MMNQIYLISFFLVLLASNLSGRKAETSYRTTFEVYDYFSGLRINKEKLLSYENYPVSSLPDVAVKSGFDDDGNYITVSRKKRNITNEISEFSITSGVDYMVRPGLLQAANAKSLMEGTPKMLNFQWNCVRIVWPPGPNFYLPSYYNYETDENDEDGGCRKIIVRSLNLSYANVRHDFDFYHSKQQLKVQFNFLPDQILSNERDMFSQQEELIIVHRLKFIYFNSTYLAINDPFPGKPDMSAPSVTLGTLSRGVDYELTPAMTVSPVLYGRVIYVKIKTTTFDDSARGGLRNVFKIDENEQLIINFAEVMKLRDLKFSIYVMGYNSSISYEIETSNFNQVSSVLFDYGNYEEPLKLDKLNKFYRPNPFCPRASKLFAIYPVSYSANFIHDNSSVVVKARANFIETIKTVRGSGTVTFDNSAGFFKIKFSLSWDELIVDKNGNEIIVAGVTGIDGLVPPLSSKDILLAGNRLNVSITLWADTAWIATEWTKILERSNIPLIKERTVSTWGTKADVQYSIKPDDDL